MELVAADVGGMVGTSVGTSVVFPGPNGVGCNVRLGVGFNVGYVQDALGALKGEMIRMRFKDANSSCLVSEVEHDRSRHVVMPLRL